MKKIVLISAQILGLTCLTLALYWPVSKYIVFNDFFLKQNWFRIFYYILSTLISISLSVIWIYYRNKMQYFFCNFLLTLIATYLFVSVFNSYGEFCDVEKNMTYKTVFTQAILIIVNCYLIFKFILPKLDKKTIFIILISTGLVLLDFFVFWFSYSIYFGLAT